MCATQSRIINNITINYDLVSGARVISSFCNLAAINYNFINAVSRACATRGKVIDTIIIVQLADAHTPENLLLLLLLRSLFLLLPFLCPFFSNSSLIVRDSYLTTDVRFGSVSARGLAAR